MAAPTETGSSKDLQIWNGAGKVSLPEAQRLLAALAFALLARDVLTRRAVTASLVDGDAVQDAVDWRFAARVPAVALLLPSGGLERGNPAVQGEAASLPKRALELLAWLSDFVHARPARLALGVAPPSSSGTHGCAAAA